MRRKAFLFVILASAFGILFLISQIVSFPSHDDSISDSWVGSYSFYEFCPPNINMEYSISICEEGDVVAYISIDGFQTLKRLKAKLLFNDTEALFEFDDYFTDEKGHSTIYESYEKGDVLLRFTRQNDGLITEWEKIQPILTENEVTEQYFVKD